MAGTSLLTLIDDIASTLDDVAAMTKIAAKKTSGVLGDDLALNAQQITGAPADREIPIVLAVAKGSAINKLILVPSALALSEFAPFLVTPALIVGGLFLCFEGAEKVIEKLFQQSKPVDRGETPTAHSEDPGRDLQRTTTDLENEKIKGAVRTDFILSAEIVVITLGTVAEATLAHKFMVLVGIAIIMTVGVYGLVAGIVKLDDLGFYLSRKRPGTLAFALGKGILAFAPYLMKGLGVVGTVAMFLVGGGIISHGIPMIHHWQEGRPAFVTMGADFCVGILSGLIVLLAVSVGKKLRAGSGGRCVIKVW